jgi:putative MFS transporter
MRSSCGPAAARTVFKLPLDVSLQYGLITQVAGLAGAALCAMTIDRFGRRPWFALAFAGIPVALGVLWL